MRLVSHSLNRVISDFATNTRALEDFITVTTREGGLSECIKKSSHKATLWLCASADHSAGVSAFDFRRWRRLISPRNAVTTNCPVLSPSSFSSSIESAISCGTLAAIVCDLAFFAPVAITASLVDWCSTVWQKKIAIQCLKCLTPVSIMVFNTYGFFIGEKTKPGSAGTLTGPLTTNAKQTSEAAMFHRNTPHTGRAALTLKKITWRFLVLGEHAPVIVHITASSEQEARAAMPPCCIAIFAARIMRGGSANA